MLEIGALIPTNYATCSSWIENLPMDLYSQHPNILEQDFFERPVPKSDAERFEVISCSLVLNFIADPRDRGNSGPSTHWLTRRQVECCYSSMNISGVNNHPYCSSCFPSLA